MWHRVAALAGSSGVALGAVGAHALTKKSEKIKRDWKTANEYQLLHAIALATLPAFQPSRARGAAGVLFSAGITLFSGSIYLFGITGDKRVTYAAPFGGMALIMGWTAMAFLKL